MKPSTIIILLFATIITVTISSAQGYTPVFTPEKYQFIIDKQFTPSLENDIDGIAEGAMYNIAVCRNYFPGLDFRAPMRTLNDIVADHPSPAIRYKAHLVLLYLANADKIVITPHRDPESYAYLFKTISDEVQRTMLAGGIAIAQK